MATHPQPQVAIIPVTKGGTGYRTDGGIDWYNDTGHSTTVSAADTSKWPFTQNSYGPIANQNPQYAALKPGAALGTYYYNYTDQIKGEVRIMGQGHIIIQ